MCVNLIKEIILYCVDWGTLKVRILALMCLSQFGKSSVENDGRAEGVGLCIVVTG